MRRTTTEGADMTLDSSTIREIMNKSVTFLETKCSRLNGSDPNWRAVLSGQLDEIRILS